MQVQENEIFNLSRHPITSCNYDHLKKVQIIKKLLKITIQCKFNIYGYDVVTKIRITLIVHHNTLFLVTISYYFKVISVNMKNKIV